MAKISNFGYFFPHCKSDNVDIWREGTDLGLSSATNFVKIAQGDLFLLFTKEFEILAIFSYLSQHFYTHNVKILLQRTDGLRNPSTTENFVKIA